MLNQKRAMLSLLLLIPVAVYASGSEVLSLLWIQVISIILFLLFIITVNLSSTQRLILSLAYIVAIASTWYFTTNIPYLPNMTKINTIVGLVPPTAVLVTFIVLKIESKSKKEHRL